MQRTYCVTFWKRFTDGRPAEKGYDIIRTNTLKAARAMFAVRACTPITDYGCDVTERPRFWVEAKR